MAITYTDNGGGAPNGSDLEFTFTFPVLQTKDVKVALNGVTQLTTKYAVDTASNPTKITFNNTSIDSNVQESTGAPKTGVTVRVFRETTVGKSTGDDDPKAVFAAGSSIRAVDLNANTEQALYAIHELQEQVNDHLDSSTGETIKDVQIGVVGDNEITTTSGNLIIDSDAGTTTVDDNLTITGDLTVQGTNINIPNAPFLSSIANDVSSAGIYTFNGPNQSSTFNRAILQGRDLELQFGVGNVNNLASTMEISAERGGIVDGTGTSGSLNRINLGHANLGLPHGSSELNSNVIGHVTNISLGRMYMNMVGNGSATFPIIMRAAYPDGLMFYHPDTTMINGGFTSGGPLGSANQNNTYDENIIDARNAADMRIISGGILAKNKVEIGSSTVADAGFKILRDATNQNTTTEIIHRGTGNFTIEANEAADMYFKTDNTTRFVVDSGGNIGIGNFANSPSRLLHLKKADANGIYIQLQNSEGSAYLGADGDALQLFGDRVYFFSEDGNSTYLDSTISLFDIKTAAKVNGNLEVTGTLQISGVEPVMNSDLDGKGELLVGDGSGDPTALAAGADGYVLKANSSTATGLEWVAESGGGGSSLTTEQIQDIVGAMFTGNTETNITATYQDSDGTIDLVSTDTNTTYSVGDGGLTQNNFTNTLKNKLDGIEASADVTDATNVASAGAVMDGDFTSNGFMKRTGAGSYTVDTNTYLTAVPSGYLQNVSEDSSPQLAANLDVQTNEITTSTSNGNIKLNPNGTGVVEVKGDGSSADGTIQLNCSQNSHGVKIKSPPHSANASYTLTLPDNDGNANQVLKTDGSGGLSWVDQTGGGSSSLTIQDEGSALSTAATTLNFVGSGVTASGTGATKTITISGGGGGGGASALNDLSDAKTDNSGEAIGIGSGALAADDGGNSTIALGKDALNDQTSGNFNCAVGVEALSKVTNTGQNMAFGVYAGRYTTGTSNVFVGYSAGEGVDGSTSGSNNVAIGEKAMENATSGGNNTAIGYRALRKVTTGSSNAAIGYNGLTNATTASYNSSLGYQALKSCTTGNFNSAFGHSALDSLTTATFNTASGYNSGENLTTGGGNSFYGYDSGEHVTTGSDNTLIGKNSGGYGTNALATGNNNICIGKNSTPSSSTVDNEITFGDSLINKFRIPGIDFVLKDNGGTPTEGHVLTVDANGEAAFAAASGGGSSDYVHISNTIISSAVSTIEISLPTGYDKFEFIVNMYSAGRAHVYISFSEDDGASYIVNNIRFSSQNTSYSSTLTSTSTNYNGPVMVERAKYITGSIKIFRASETSKTRFLSYFSGLDGASSNGSIQRASGVSTAQTARLNKIKFKATGAYTFDSGKISLYGIKDS